MPRALEGKCGRAEVTLSTLGEHLATPPANRPSDPIVTTGLTLGGEGRGQLARPQRKHIFALRARQGLYDLLDQPASYNVSECRVPVEGFYFRTGKRLFDLVFGSIALILALPVLVLLALALWLERGKPFYAQPRLGQGGRVFQMWKFRTMVVGAEQRLHDILAKDPALAREWALTQKLKRDPRVTWLGKFLRMTSLDELPQLFNVLKGDMSLVGPRPMLPEQAALHPYAEVYFSLRPGITGLWQVTARNEGTFALRARCDRAYAEVLSASTDLRIIAKTFGAMLRATGY